MSRSPHCARPRVRPRRADARGERGAVAVEFALVLPLVLVLLFGIIGYGFMLSFRQGISQAAAEGAPVLRLSTPRQWEWVLARLEGRRQAP